MRRVSSFLTLKGFAALILLVVGTLSASAQAYYINVYQKDGKKVKFLVTDVDSVKFSYEKAPVQGVEYVDLGLSVMWANCNIGATSPYDAGDYYSWGETETKDTYTRENYKYYNPSILNGFTKYNYWTDYGAVDYKHGLDMEDDAARVNWGSDWRMPTVQEMEELVYNCKWQWTVIDSTLTGYTVTGPNGNSIFLPSGDYRDDSQAGIGGTCTSYLSASLNPNYNGHAYGIDFSSEFVEISAEGRMFGELIRPVYSSDTPENIAEVYGFSLNEESVTLSLGEYHSFNPEIWCSFWVEPVITITGDACLRMHRYQIEAIAPGTATVIAKVGEFTSECVVTVLEPEIVAEPVDLGLSVMWATCNLGADSPEKYGFYYAWGETRPKAIYEYSTYKWFDYASGVYTKYTSDATNGKADGKIVLDLEDDAAHELWGDDWRMPTPNEFEELMENCNWNWVIRDGVEGYEVTSLVKGYEGNSIFLPASGFNSGSYPYDQGYCAYYWTSWLSDNDDKSQYLYFDGDGEVSIWHHYRVQGRTIRPVKSFVSPDVDVLVIDKTELKLVIGESCTLDVKGMTASGRTVNLKDIEWMSSNDSVAFVWNGELYALGEGKCTITAIYENKTVSCQVTVVNPADVTPEYVDLGLSVNWATFNVGAYRPDMAGDYYSWGSVEVTPDYAMENYRFFTGYDSTGYAQFSKYVTDISNGLFGVPDNKLVLETKDDVASVTWAGDWRMPTYLESYELLFLCSWEWVEINGVPGYKVTSNVDGYTDRSIFLPAAGVFVEGDGVSDKDYYGYYWTNSLYRNNPTGAYGFYFGEGEDYYGMSSFSRKYGFSVRPVCPSDKWPGITSIRLEYDTVSVSTDNSISIGCYFMSGSEDYSFMADMTDVVWSSDNPDVAQVDEYGNVITFSTIGTATITARYNGFEASCRITVFEKTTDMLVDEVFAKMKALGNRADDFGYPSVMMFTDANGMDEVQTDGGYNWSGTSLGLLDRNNAYAAPKVLWNNLYVLITSSNSMIDRIGYDSDKPADMYNLGQMLALRAFSYWNLAQLFQFNYAGNENKPCVPLITERNAEDAIANGCPRATVAEVYAQIQSDLNNAIGLLASARKSGLTRSDKNHFDVSVAYGLRARVNLTMGLWNEAAADAQAAIDASDARPSTMAEASRPAFWTADEPDWMWGIIINEDDDVVQSLYINYPSHMGSFNEGYCEVNGGRQISKALFNSISGTDVRKGWWIDANCYSPNLSLDELNYLYNAGYKAYTQVKFAPYLNELGTDINANDIPLMRIEEMYLILAEGMAMSGDAASAKSVLESFVRRYRDTYYTCPDVTGTELQDEIWRQRRIEFWGEGLSWFDIMRLGKDVDRRGAGYESHLVFNIPAGSDILLWRIPVSEIKTNPLISENDNNPEANAPEPVDDYTSGITPDMMTGSYMFIYHSARDTSSTSMDTLTCSIVEGESSSLIIRDLLFDGSEIEAEFDEVEGTLMIKDIQYLGLYGGTYYIYLRPIESDVLTFYCTPNGFAKTNPASDSEVAFGFWAADSEGNSLGYLDWSEGQVYLEPYSMGWAPARAAARQRGGTPSAGKKVSSLKGDNFIEATAN